MHVNVPTGEENSMALDQVFLGPSPGLSIYNHAHTFRNVLATPGMTAAKKDDEIALNYQSSVETAASI